MAECTIYDKLRYIAETKDLIKTAIETQDVEVLESDTFRKYAEYITEIRKVASVNGETGDIILKTINGQNLVGEGDIVIQGGNVDLSDYYTKQEVDDKIPSLDGYATEQWVEDKNYLTEHQSLEDYAKKSDIPDVSEFIKEIPSEYITEEELNGKGYLTSIPDTYVTDGELSTAISDKVSQNALNEAIEGVENKIPSLDGYATEQWVENKKYLTEHQDLTEYAKKSELPSVEGLASEQWVNQQGFLKEHQSLEDYAKKSDIPTIPTSNTAFTNDAGFITINEVPPTDLSDYYTKTETYSKDEVDGLLENTGGGGGSSLNVIELTQAEYDALSEKQTDTIYVITDAVELKFKTINGQEITGEGDIEIQVNTEQFYTKSEIDALIGGVSDKITELNELI